MVDSNWWNAEHKNETFVPEQLQALSLQHHCLNNIFLGFFCLRQGYWYYNIGCVAKSLVS